MIFTHSGNSGDIVFSIPTINHLCNNERKATLYIKRALYMEGDQYTFCKDFLLLQDSIKEVIPFIPSDNNWNYFNWPDLKMDYDLDDARKQLQRGRIHIVKRYYDAFGIKKDHTITPFLKIDNEPTGITEPYALIHLTPRWNGLMYDWKKIYDEAAARHKNVYFVGLTCEWLDFTIRYQQIVHLTVNNLLEMARHIRDCEALYCNQGVALTIAQGLGKEYFLVKNGYKTNCHLGTNNEHLLGENYLHKESQWGREVANNPLTRPDAHIRRTNSIVSKFPKL